MGLRLVRVVAWTLASPLRFARDAGGRIVALSIELADPRRAPKVK